MTDAEFREWLESEVAGRRMTKDQRSDLLDQKEIFDAEIPNDRRSEYLGWIVGYVAGERCVAREIHALLQDAKSRRPGRMIYFEPIGFDLA